jgi:hypothetical protein
MVEISELADFAGLLFRIVKAIVRLGRALPISDQQRCTKIVVLSTRYFELGEARVIRRKW